MNNAADFSLFMESIASFPPLSIETIVYYIVYYNTKIFSQ